MAKPTVPYGPGVVLVVVDLQHDFADPAGSLYVRNGEEVVSRADAEIGRARAAGSNRRLHPGLAS